MFSRPLLAFFSIFWISLAGLSVYGQPIKLDKEAQFMHALEVLGKQIAPDRRSTWFEVEKDTTGTLKVYTTEPLAKGLLDSLHREMDWDGQVDVILLPEATDRGISKALVCLSVANLRSKPAHSAELASQALMGTTVDVLRKIGGYYLIRTPDGYISYVDAEGITLPEQQELVYWQDSDKLIITGDYGHVYSDTSANSMRVSDLVMGDRLLSKGEKTSHYRVELPDGRPGYIKKELAQPYKKWLSSGAPDAAKLFKIAKSMMGVPYLWGGTSVKGLDCSGFTKTVFFMNGLVIPRDASQQVLAGSSVEVLTNDQLDTRKALRNMLPGDLIFFAAGKGRKPDARITHVALYLGEGEFIQAAGQVRINSMLPEADNYDDFQSRTVVAVKRYLNAADDSMIKAIADE